MERDDDQKDLTTIAEVPAIQDEIRDSMRERDTNGENPFQKDPAIEKKRRMLAHHKLWLESISHECPSIYTRFRIGVYIRYFNQTKYPNYLEFHKQEFIRTIAMCPNWTLVDFYVDEGQNAPYMENATDWCRLLEDCTDGKVNLIITQKVSNVSRNPAEMTFCARMLAALEHPVGIYFISEDIYTLATYYQEDLHETGFLPDDVQAALDFDADNAEGTR